MDTLIEGIARVAGKTWRCLICDGKTGTFDELDDHMRTEHEFTLGTIYAGESVSWPERGFMLRNRTAGEKSVLLTFEFASLATGRHHAMQVVLKGRSDGLKPVNPDAPVSFAEGTPMNLVQVDLDVGEAFMTWSGAMELGEFFNRSM